MNVLSTRQEQLSYPSTAILHYSAPPIIGGVEAVIEAHVRVFLAAGYPVSIVAGRGEQTIHAPITDFIHIPYMDSQHPKILILSTDLDNGKLPVDFESTVNELMSDLQPIVSRFDNIIVHNLFTKHFNLPLTAALYHLLDTGHIKNCIAWCHDFTWTSPNSRSKVHSGYPWDFLRTQRPDVTYVVVSNSRQHELAELFDCPVDQIQVIYNGVDPVDLLGLSPEGQALIERLNLLDSDLTLLMPVRVTQAKNIEYALHTLAALKAQNLGPKLILTGPPDPHDAKSIDYFHSLQELRQQLGLEDHMHFIFESGPDPKEPYFIKPRVVGDLFRISDIMFMPSHREGFGMPVLEAGLVGLPVVSANVPASVEIGGTDVTHFDAAQDPAHLAEIILDWAATNSTYQLRRRVRQNYTWQAIFRRQIEPLIR